MDSFANVTQSGSSGGGLSDIPLQGLLLDDSATDRLRIKRLCQKADLSIEFSEAGTIGEFASKIDSAAYDLVLLDYRLIQGDGLIALEMLKRHPLQQKAASIMIAGDSQIQVAVDAMKNGCSDFLLKDMMGPEMLSRSVAHALASSHPDSDPRDVPGSIESALVRFAHHSGAEMRSILSGLLRRTRALRHAVASEQKPRVEDISKIDENCVRLWEFLEEYQAFVAEFRTPPRRLN